MHLRSICQLLCRKSGFWQFNQVWTFGIIPVYLAIGYKIFLPLAELITNFSLLLLSSAFLIYVAATVSVVVALMLHFEPRYGQTNVLVYLGICSLMGALTVIIFYSSLLPSSSFILWWNVYTTFLLLDKMRFCTCEHFASLLRCSVKFYCILQVVSIKAIGIAIKLTLEGISQIAYS